MILFYPHTAQLFFKNECNFPLEYPILVFAVTFTALPLMILFIIPRAIKYHKNEFRSSQKNNSTLSSDLEKFEQTWLIKFKNCKCVNNSFIK